MDVIDVLNLLFLSTLIDKVVGGAGMRPFTYKLGTFFAMPLANFQQKSRQTRVVKCL